MSTNNRNADIRLDLSLDDIIEQERKKNELARKSNVAVLCKKVEEFPEDEVMYSVDEFVPNEDDTKNTDDQIKNTDEEVNNNTSSNFKRNVFQRRKQSNVGNNRGNFQNNNKTRSTRFNNSRNANIKQNFRRKNNSFIPQQRYNQNSMRNRNSCNVKGRMSHRQRTYLLQLRRLRNAQAINLLGQPQFFRRYNTSTPNSNMVVCPLTSNYLNKFDSYNRIQRGVSLFDLASPASIGSFASLRSRTPNNFRRNYNGSQVSLKSGTDKSNTSSRTAVLDPNLTEEIAHIQSAFKFKPNYRMEYDANRTPVGSIQNSSTDLSLSSRFNSYYCAEN